jgi:beta-lactamase regulating signal transducer with metallopeptidase domain
MSSQLLLTFLLNSLWQIALIAALAAAGSWLLRDSVARYRHWLWVSALCLAFIVPAITSLRTLGDTVSVSSLNSYSISPPEAMRPFTNQTVSEPAFALPSTFQLSQNVGFLLLALFCGFLLYRIFKLVQAWRNTRIIRRLAVELYPDENLAEVISTCERQVGIRAGAVKILRSETLPVPVTIGLSHPVIILPEELLREGNIELLTSAIGHEFIHVARRDYLLNFIYELLFVPISFHPAAALLRRRVRQTRELCCDELVAERILNAEVYARSLVRLASSAPPLRRLSVTTTVGIADADILEARIMSLLRKPKFNTRWKKLSLVAVALLLLVPCVAAAAFAIRFEVDPWLNSAMQEQERKEKEKLTEADKEKLEMKVRQSRERLKLNEEMKERLATDPQFRREFERRREVEMEMQSIRQAALVKLARINMDQAIQIATSHTPGKVLICSLDAKGWEEPGKLGKDGVVFYHVIIADEANAGATYVWVNAIDGTVMKTEKELPRKMRSPEGN